LFHILWRHITGPALLSHRRLPPVKVVPVAPFGGHGFQGSAWKPGFC
jgi:hypothetical protein